MKDLFVIKNNELERGPAWPGSIASSEAALDMSIAKWETVVDYIERTGKLLYDGQADTCGLCEMYFGKHCQGCIVAEATNVAYCASTPFVKYKEALAQGNVVEGLAAARAELAFLKSLKEGAPNEQGSEALQSPKG
jgi:hypothetical protein